MPTARQRSSSAGGTVPRSPVDDAAQRGAPRSGSPPASSIVATQRGLRCRAAQRHARSTSARSSPRCSIAVADSSNRARAPRHAPARRRSTGRRAIRHARIERSRAACAAPRRRDRARPVPEPRRRRSVRSTRRRSRPERHRDRHPATAPRRRDRRPRSSARVAGGRRAARASDATREPRRRRARAANATATARGRRAAEHGMRVSADVRPGFVRDCRQRFRPRRLAARARPDATIVASCACCSCWSSLLAVACRVAATRRHAGRQARAAAGARSGQPAATQGLPRARREPARAGAAAST